MRTLMITPWSPGPQRPRSLQTLRYLQTQGDVSLVTAVSSQDELDQAQQLGTARLRTVRLRRPAGVRRAVTALFTGTQSLQQAYVSDPEFRQAIVAEVSSFDPHIVLFNVLRTAQFRAAAGSRRAIIDLDEFRSGYYAQLASTSSNPGWRLLGAIESKRMLKAEGQLPEDFTDVLVSSPTDLRPSHPNIQVLRTPVGHLPQHLAKRAVGSKTIVFSGRQSYRANIEGARWFTERVLGSILTTHPEAQLKIVGADPPRSVRRLAGKGIQVTGTVPSIAPYLSNARVAIVPIFQATGVQMKVLEAMAAGIPCVVTPVVAAGAGITHGVHCVVANSPHEWATGISRLLEDDLYWEELSQNGYRWVRDNHSTQATGATLRRILAADKS